MQYSVVQYSVVQCRTLNCNAVQLHILVQCSAGQCKAMLQEEGMQEARSVLRLGSELGVRGPRRVFQIEVGQHITGEVIILLL